MDLNRILLIRTGALGDFIVTLPVLSALKAAAPRARIHLLGHPKTLALAGDYAHGIAGIEQADWAPFFVPNGRLSPRFADPLKTTDLVLSYLPDPDATFTANLQRAGARTVLSFPPHPPPDGSVHVVDHLLRPLSDLHIPVADPVPRVPLTREDHRQADRILPHSEGAPPIVIHPGSGGAIKRWPAERFSAVADRLARRTGRPVVLLSGPADGDLAGRIASRMQTAPIRTPPLALRHLAALLRRASVYLGNDSGPSHLAAAVGTPAVVLFGPTDPRIWAPRGEAVRILQGDPHLPPEHRLQTISVNNVVEALLGEF